MGEAAPASDGAAMVAWKRLAVRVDPFDVLMEVPERPDDVVRARAVAGDAERGYWAHLWGSSEVLARHVSSTSLLTPGMRVLEIGAGLGLVSVVAGLRGCEVVVTDREPPAVEACLRNAALNGVGDLVRGAVFDWRHQPDPSWRPEVLLAADVVYKPNNAAQIASLIASLDCIAFMSEPNRTQSAAVPEALREAGLRVWTAVVRGGRVITAQR